MPIAEHRREAARNAARVAAARAKSSDKGLIAGIVTLIVGAVLLHTALLIGSVVALTWGIIDLTNVGPNPWAIVWIILGGFYLLSTIVQAIRK